MIATATDIKPLEILMFTRAVRSRNFFEQMKGRGVRVINQSDFNSVTPGSHVKDKFVIVDCVGDCESNLSESRPLERKPSAPLDKLVNAIARGSSNKDNCLPQAIGPQQARMATPTIAHPLGVRRPDRTNCHTVEFN